MSLSPGTRLGSYEVLSHLGAGGMGEVYRARDTRLGRDVAIKTLPEEFAQDVERLSRFEREARVLASLTHSNIAAIHGVEEVEARRYLVLEFVDGETLAQRLSRGPLPVDEAIDICRDIAAGVEAAHENGVVHRDLKPGNIIITPSGQVKVLDFGLATASGATATGSNPNLSHSPTMTHQATRAGVILGTAAYMSPEQARGRVVDRRTDIWSFGCVLFECLTGRALFEGETVSDLIARILEREPDWSALPASTPPRVRELLKKCLRKDPKERLRDIGDARLELQDTHAVVSEESPISTARARGS
ncbi:MAG TPA: serine/threonine-protein kinase, partial [Candidatus Krumholzibacteria bacterium]|nr:serine/threonine-protein kinase [Candidatus Krumholzibacteria bacterium]